MKILNIVTLLLLAPSICLSMEPIPGSRIFRNVEIAGDHPLSPPTSRAGSPLIDPALQARQQAEHHTNFPDYDFASDTSSPASRSRSNSVNAAQSLNRSTSSNSLRSLNIDNSLNGNLTSLEQSNYRTSSPRTITPSEQTIELKNEAQPAEIPSAQANLIGFDTDGQPIADLARVANSNLTAQELSNMSTVNAEHIATYAPDGTQIRNATPPIIKNAQFVREHAKHPDKNLNELLQTFVAKKITEELSAPGRYSEKMMQNRTEQTENNTIINILRTEFDSSDLIMLLFYAPRQATQQAPVARKHLWSAITSNMTENLGLNKASRFIQNRITSIRDAASKTLDAILGDRKITNDVKQTRIEQLIENTNTMLKNIAQSIHATGTKISDVVSGSETKVIRDPQGNITEKIVEKDDKIIYYTYKDGKIVRKIIDLYKESEKDPEGDLEHAFRDVYQYDTKGELVSRSTQPTLPSAFVQIISYFAQGKIFAEAQITQGKKPNELLISYKNNTTLDSGQPNINYSNKRVVIPKKLQNAEPIIDGTTGKITGWEGIDKSTQKQVTLKYVTPVKK